MRDEEVDSIGSSAAKRVLDLESESERPQKVVKPDASGDRSGNDGEMSQTNPRLQRYLVAVEYIGTRFYGSQKQPDCRTVIGALEEAFHKFIGQPVSVICSSRTDAGVHALSNVCHVDVERISKRKPDQVLPPHEPGVVRRAVNHFLQKNEGDITVTDVKCVPSDFHSRFMAKERTYYYRVISGPELLSTFDKDRVWHVNEDLDIASMKKACNVLVGDHDFSSFRASGCQANSPIRTLDEITITETLPALTFPSILERSGSDILDLGSSRRFSGSSECGKRKEFGQRERHQCFVITARARSFLYHQVRLMVGVLKCVGTGELTVNDVERILEAKTVAAASPMAPSYGLYLGHVKYDDLP